MQKILIVGANGFAGSYLQTEMRSHGYDVYGADLFSEDDRVFKADMLRAQEVNAVVEAVRPDGIFNLSGFASPHQSWDHVLTAMHLNIDISVNLAEAMRQFCPQARLLIIGSSQQYDVAAAQGKPISESTPQLSGSPYDVSKRAQEELLKLLAQRYSLDILFTRSFNHIGPGQKVGFVVPDFASRIVSVENGKATHFTVGDLAAWRDFSDVRDIVRGYRLLYEKGRRNETYNIGSGKAYQIQWILDTLLKYSTVSPDAVQSTVPKSQSKEDVITCDIQKIQNDTGYAPQRNLEDTLREILEYFRSTAH